MKLYIATILLSLLSHSIIYGQNIDFSAIKSDHPRILFDQAKLDARIAYFESGDETYDQIITLLGEVILQDYNSIANQGFVIYEPIDGNKTARTFLGILSRLSLCSVLELDGKDECLNKALVVVDALLEYETWLPGAKSEFLSVAEFTVALSIAYDWLYPHLSEEKKTEIREKIYTCAIMPYYDKRNCTDTDKNCGGLTAEHNWSCVTGAGILMGGLSILGELDEDSVREAHTKAAMQIAFDNLTNSCLNSYEESGAYYESMIYWEYATSYLALALSALETSMAQDFGLNDNSVLQNTCDFGIAATSPKQYIYNYGDNDFYIKSEIDHYPLLYFAERNNNDTYSNFFWKDFSTSLSEVDKIYGNDRFFFTVIPWYRINNTSFDLNEEIEGFKYFEGTKVEFISYRAPENSSSRRENLYFIMRGGQNGLNHQQLDLGTFTIHNDGLIWATDFGADDYNLSKYFNLDADSERWNYFRNRTEAHNVVDFGGENQKLKASAHFFDLDTVNKNDISFKIDLSDAYSPYCFKYIRSVNIKNAEMENCETEIWIEDEIWDPKQAGDINWNFYSFSNQGNGHNYTMEDSVGREYKVKKETPDINISLIEPIDASFDLSDVANGEGEKSNTAFKRLRVTQSSNVGDIVRFKVLIK